MKLLKFCGVYASIILIPGIIGPLSGLSFGKCLFLNYCAMPIALILSEVICKYMGWDKWMHKATIEINVFDKGDYVRTPRGVGIVIDIEEYTNGRYDIMIQHKFGDEDNTSNRPKVIDGDVPMLITKEEYDNEKH